MKIQDQVCTFEQALRLKELGVGQVGSFWTSLQSPDEILCAINPKRVGMDREWAQLSDILLPYKNFNCVSRFTVAELGVMLPDDYLRADIDKSMKYGYAIGVWPTNVRGNWGKRTEYNGECTFHPTEAQARAAMLIHLLETKLITPEQVNASLTQQQ